MPLKQQSVGVDCSQLVMEEWWVDDEMRIEPEGIKITGRKKENLTARVLRRYEECED